MPESFHTPVLVEAVVAALEPVFPGASAPRQGWYVDATTGGAGHSAEVLSRFAVARATCNDRDPEALSWARERLAQSDVPIEFVHGTFSDLLHGLRDTGARVTALLADLGVSSHQLDSGSRGFSFREDAPLDMRMDPSRGITAAEWVATRDRDAVARVLRDFGEEPDARRIAEAIVAARPTTTLELASVVRGAMSAVQLRKIGKRVHPATRTFQALRIAVNGEFDELQALLDLGPQCLAPGGRLLVISFHSLEDKAVARAFRKRCRPPEFPANVPMTAREVPRSEYRVPKGWNRGRVADSAELDANPRARSARLRVLERIAA